VRAVEAGSQFGRTGPPASFSSRVMPSLLASRKIWLASCAAFTVVAVLATFALVGRAREQRRVGCLANLRQIDSAIINVALERKYHRGQRIPPEQFTWCLREDRIPICPAGGRYAIPPVGGHTVCSYHGDLLAEDGWLKGPSLLDGNPLE